MNEQSIYFLQALWDVEVRRDELIQIAKSAMLFDIENTFKGVLNEQTLWISPEAIELYHKLLLLKKRVDSINKPYDLLNINNEFISISGSVKALQIKTAQGLSSKSGMIMEDMHIVVKQLFPYFLYQIKKQTSYQLYRLCVLNGSLPQDKLHLPDEDKLQEWLNFYSKQLLPLFDLFSNQQLDSRWAYERRNVIINGKIQIEQFVSVDPIENELKQPLGVPGVGTGEKGEFRIFGRGMITNLKPRDFEKRISCPVEHVLPNLKDFSKIPTVNDNPTIVLNQIFKGKHYLIDSQKYFAFINTFILAETFYYRYKTGSCFYCGAQLYMNKCSRCGTIWKF